MPLPKGLPICALHKSKSPAAVTTTGCRGGAFASLLSGPRYVRAAICLRAQLQTVESRCRHLLIYDDQRVAANTRLTTAYGAHNLVPLSALQRRMSSGNTTYGAQWDFMQARAAASPGRRLYAGFQERAVNFLKFWLWALPGDIRNIVYIDVDVLILRNIDELVGMNLHVGSLAAVSAGCDSDPCVFNAGLFVLRPSLITLSSLLLQRSGQYVSQSWTRKLVLCIPCVRLRVMRQC